MEAERDWQNRAVTDLSVVVPVFNEAGSIGKLHEEIVVALNARPQCTADLIYVDDGSTDGSLQVLAEIAKTDGRVSVIELSRNFGQTAAMYAGFQASSGRIIVPLDGDGQNDPADIFRLADTLDQGFDCVSGWRVERQERWVLCRAGEHRLRDGAGDRVELRHIDALRRRLRLGVVAEPDRNLVGQSGG